MGLVRVGMETYPHVGEGGVCGAGGGWDRDVSTDEWDLERR